MAQTISVHGLGKLGCTMMACFASKGFNVIGIDVNENTVDRINQGESPIYEPQVEELIKSNQSRILASTDPFAAAAASVSFIIVPTPSSKDGSFSLDFVDKAAADVAKLLRRDEDPYRVIVITSTVLPNDMDRIRGTIENVSGKKCSVDFGLVYNPDFIALGRVVHDFLNPDMILIGESDKRAGDIVEKIHRDLVDSTPTIHRMNWWNAELAKISLNSFCVTKISFANMLAEVCEKMPGGDASIVARAVGADSRVGQKYFRPGLPVGGPCFGRDLRAFSQAASRFNVKAPLADTVDKQNEFYKTYRIPKLVTEIMQERKTDRLSVLGLTYKEDTTLIEESASVAVVKLLSREGMKITVYDPVGMDEARKELSGSPNVNFAESLESCIKDTALCFVATPWPEFKVSASVFNDNMTENAVILDAWNLYDFDRPQIRRIGKG